ncbi:hypothetical protein KP509_01G000600 [Ceratopteris richardii]|uniref:C2 domain-containing protein n=1 Tax=Ceratopteris richardii TaxID=49495 RepID=A0A8T2VHG2_CERRI|nr:hypothetical protein KP509_01G000600 [Ceratopteris richardii]
MEKKTEGRFVYITLYSANDIENVNLLSKMVTCAKLKFPPFMEYETKFDAVNGTNPIWNEKVGFFVPERVYQLGEGFMTVEIFTKGTLSSVMGTKFVCEARIPFMDITTAAKPNETSVKRYPLKTSTGAFHGELTIHFTVGERVPNRTDLLDDPIFSVSEKSDIRHSHDRFPPKTAEVSKYDVAQPQVLHHSLTAYPTSTMKYELDQPRMQPSDRAGIAFDAVISPGLQSPAKLKRIGHINVPSKPATTVMDDFESAMQLSDTPTTPIASYGSHPSHLQQPWLRSDDDKHLITGDMFLSDSPNVLFSSPIGKLLLSDLGSRNYSVHGGY